MFDSLKKKISRKVTGADKVSEAPVAFSPLGMKLGSRVHIKNNAHIIYKSIFKTDKAGYMITAIGRFSMANSDVYRYYMGDIDDLSPGKTMLQIITDNISNEIEEIRVFDLAQTFYPSTEASWNKWVGVAGSKIGDMDANHDGFEYTRMESWADPDLDWADPVAYVERIATNNKTLRVDSINHVSMMYGRWLHEDHGRAEYLLLSSVELPNSCGIVVFAGIDISESEIEVLF